MSGRKDDATLAGRIKIGMATAGIKGASDLGRRMKVNRQTVHRWINGEGEKLTPEMLFKLSDALRVNPKWLALGPPHSPIPPHIPSPEETQVLQIYSTLDQLERSDAKDSWLSAGRDLVRIAAPVSVGNPFPTRHKVK